MAQREPRTTPAWFLAAMIVLAVGTATACGLWLTWLGIDGTRARLTGMSGYVSVSECHWKDDGRNEGWECRGTFNGPGLYGRQVRIHRYYDEKPVNPVPALVSGPNATTAWPPDTAVLMPLLAGIFMVGLFPAFSLYYWWKGRREKRAEDATWQREYRRRMREVAALRAETADRRAARESG